MTKTPWTGAKADGAFRRKSSEFRGAITSAGPHAPEAGRYHVYAQYACPWAHRVLLHRALLGLDDEISVDIVSWAMQPDGSWAFEPEREGCTADSIGAAHSLQEVYRAADPGFAGIGTVPVLWDKQHATIVNNESREIIRMMNTVLAPALGRDAPETLLPPGMAADVDAMIDANYETVNNAVYKCGFARTQHAYDDAIEALFRRLAELEAHMAGRQWLVGADAETRPWAQGHDRPDAPGFLTEADICLFTTLLRFDPVYHTHFKCNVAKIAEMPNLWAFVKRLYRLPGVAATVKFDHIRKHYYASHTHINPFGIVPKGPDMERLLMAD